MFYFIQKILIINLRYIFSHFILHRLNRKRLVINWRCHHGGVVKIIVHKLMAKGKLWMLEVNTNQ